MYILHYKDMVDGILFIVYFFMLALSSITAIRINDYYRKKISDFPTKLFILTICVIIGTVVLGIEDINRHTRQEIYNEGLEYESLGDYYNAYLTYQRLYNMGYIYSSDGYKDVKERKSYTFKRYNYEFGHKYLNDRLWHRAYEYFKEISGYLNSDRLAEYCLFKYLQEEHPSWEYDIIPYEFQYD